MSVPDLRGPLTLASGVVLPSRVLLAPLTTQLSNPDGTLSAAERRWLLRRSRGGYGALISCATSVSNEGKTWAGQLELIDDHHEESLSGLAGDIRRNGSRAIIQLFHGGLRADPAVSGRAAIAPSADEAAPWQAASTDDIARVIRDFTEAARRAVRAGFDGIEIHAAHGYFIAQFLSRTENARTDQYGGSLANRARVLRDIVRGVRREVPERFVVGVRLSSEDIRQSRGIDLDESAQVAAWAAEDGADYIHASLWDVRRRSQKHPDIHPLRAFRQAIPARVPIVTAGKIWTRDDAAMAIDSGADAVAVGRAAIVNPTWPREVASPAPLLRRPPLSEAEYDAIDVGAPFIEFIRGQWPEMVEGPHTSCNA